MTLEIKNTWNGLNRVLTIINLVLLMVLTAQGFDYKKVKGKTVPVYLNVALLLVLGFAVSATIYGLFR
ncbi:hypothetical protein [Pontibacter lucknowensis]|uniref:Uncharacterized protein n=1 Tax=Pontibacter lucknowensis TaxID=1077936 RepID=A0A1N6ULT4_9BACT|nr:hypothetical protein [Pontibacter lucknowensis]EJF09044.1 hypothetical protein O71_17311 [Pontibacter sp. BAB1700]SIQ66580.1 hypothetical protein SAMN05421545_0957 [Pontibacter lucknowensis]